MSELVPMYLLIQICMATWCILTCDFYTFCTLYR